MTLFLNPLELERFRALVASRYGLRFEHGRQDQLGEVLAQALDRWGVTVDRSAVTPAAHYLQTLAAGRLPPDEQRLLIQSLVVTETHFFRHPDQFRALTESVLPTLLSEQTTPRRLTFLSAGCASGEEAYSLALTLKEQGQTGAVVHGIDLNAVGLAKAALGRFTDWSLRGLSDELRQRYFRTAGREFILEESLRTQVTFSEQNLTSPDAQFWQPAQYDVIFCRNVLMYFTPEAMREVLTRLASALVPGGFLFVGPAESLRGLSQDFHLRHSHEAFYYQRRQTTDSVAPGLARSGPVGNVTSTWPVLAPAVDESWVDAICRASQRIAKLGRQPVPLRPGEPLPTADRHDLTPARDLVRQERFAEALQLLQARPAPVRRDPDAQLLQAMILTNQGNVAQAEQVCRQVLLGDELNAEAHYLLALCREHAGELQAAMEEDQAAIYLDPEFAMPHLHLGLMHKRAGQRDAARRAFQQASALLPCAAASHVLLFGGGFTREALLQLCLNELLACGAES